jgi:hypothetical protein
MTLNQNQFDQVAILGMSDLRFNVGTLSCQVDSSQATALVAGAVVKVVDSAGGVPKVAAVAADGDEAFGVVMYSIKDAQFPAGARVEIAGLNSVVFMQATAAIARGARVQATAATPGGVATVASTKHIIGQALDKAASGALVRVQLFPGLGLVG